MIEEQLKPIIPLARNVKHYHSNVSRASDKITSERTIGENRHPTRSKAPIIANQLEVKQINSPTNATSEPIIDAADTPSFRCDHLIKGEDKDVWQNSFCREIGCLAQGCKDVEGKTLYF